MNENVNQLLHFYRYNTQKSFVYTICARNNNNLGRCFSTKKNQMATSAIFTMLKIDHEEMVFSSIVYIGRMVYNKFYTKMLDAKRNPNLHTYLYLREHALQLCLELKLVWVYFIYYKFWGFT